FSDGVPDGVEPLAPIVDRFYPGVAECAANGNEVLAFGATLAESGVWRTDGTAAGTALLLPGLDPYSIATVPVFERFRAELYFGLPLELDAIPRGATDPSQVRTLVSSLSTGTLKAAGERLFYGGWEGLELTDGLTDPIVLLPPPDPPDYQETGDLVAAGENLFFTVDAPATGVELWRSDGTPAGSGLVVDLRPGPEGSFPRRERRELFNQPWEERIAPLGPDSVVFAADDGVAGTELWASDGTAAGTVLVADLDPGPDGSWPRHLVGADGVAYFAAEHPKLGLELYRTDGTAAGTRMVRDLVVGPGSSAPEELTLLDGVLYFSAWTPADGRELWRSDGTFQGTWRLTDVAPGPLSSSPDRILRRGDRLFFVATDHVHGFELWARADDGSLPLFIDGFETGDTSRWSLATP
ncbi:MAG TPA: ELWxxDGT repeat protein, partial [Thermoanaerobaculia bacterium]|nr:ELWxxDGT repeat protein [Thermoanaerobaculia bacterium]